MRRLRIFIRRMFHEVNPVKRWDWYKAAWDRRARVYLKWKSNMAGGYPTPEDNLKWGDFKDKVWPHFESCGGDKT